jgi:hypothetical protein
MQMKQNKCLYRALSEDTANVNLVVGQPNHDRTCEQYFLNDRYFAIFTFTP